MRAVFVHISQHAQLRWYQRVGYYLVPEEIEKFVKQSKIIKKNEIIPYNVPRLKDTVYSSYEDILFILEPVSIDEFNLITLYTFNHVFMIPMAARQNKAKALVMQPFIV